MDSYIYILLTFIPAFLGSVFYRKYKDTFLKYFLFYLWYCFGTELLAYYVGFILKTRTVLIYNIYILISVIFYYALFSNYVKKYKLFIRLILIGFLVFYTINFLYIQKTIVASQTNSILVGSLVISFGVVFLFYELLKSDSILNLNKMLLFWIAIGAFLFFLGISPILVFAKYFNYRGMYDHIILALNIVMAGCFITGFIMSKKEFNNLT